MDPPSVDVLSQASLGESNPTSVVCNSAGDVIYISYGEDEHIIKRIMWDKNEIPAEATVEDVAGELGSTGDNDGCGTGGDLKFKYPVGMALSQDDATLYVLENDGGDPVKGGLKSLDTT